VMTMTLTTCMCQSPEAFTTHWLWRTSWAVWVQREMSW